MMTAYTKDKLRRPKGILILQWNDEKPLIYENLVVDAGLHHIGDIMDGTETTYFELLKIGAGSGSTTVDEDDTALETEIAKIGGQSGSYPTRDGDVLKNAWQVGSGELIGTWREVGVFFGDDDMWSHINVAERTKADGDVVSIWYYTDLVN